MSVERPLAGSADTQTTQQSWITKLAKYCDDATIMRTAFYSLAFGVAVTLVLDYRAMLEADNTIIPVLTPRTQNPILPAFTPPAEGEEAPQTIAPEITTPQEVLRQAMTIELAQDGVLQLTGFIDVGTAATFNTKIEDISEYVKIVELNSPGGSVFDALEISSKIRELGWTTRVSDGNLCASSCPLVFSGGKKRVATEKAALGVHQFFAVGENTQSTGDAISTAQRTTARITRHLEAMDVDPALWIHALETPPQQLYYFSPEELKKYKLVTK